MLKFLAARRENIILALMLVSLHGSIWGDFGSPLSRSLMLIHFGLFLIWQPVWRGDQKLAWNNLLTFILLTGAFLTWMNWWLLFAWLILLVGFCGGRATLAHAERRVYLVVLAFLGLELVIPCTTMLFHIAVASNVKNLFQWLLPALPVVVAVIPSRTDDRSMRTVDILHSISAATLFTVLIIGSLLIMYRTGAEYLVALAQTMIAIAVFLFGISWLLTPRLGFSGLTQVWQRSISNIGTPFEQWLTRLSNLFKQESSPDEFLEAAVEELMELSWVAGVSWSNGGPEGLRGERTRHANEFRFDPLKLCVFSQRPLGGALYLHCRLLVHLIDHFYVAKLQERELTKQTHLQAIYETGARVTHDIKNLLQSLQAITSIVVNDEPGDASVSRKLLRGQLPHLTQRLQLALDKLQAPAAAGFEEVYLKDWWHDLQRRTNQKNIKFQFEVAGDPAVPVELFDSVIENLLENVREKSRIESGLEVTITLFGDFQIIQLSVCDNGSRIPPETAQRLLAEPLRSGSGLGIGLFQAARQAETLGYSLSLSHNENGRVCFDLKTAPAVQAKGRVA
ncbi:MAG: HAMP domain-containing histidine kinase [Gammaproteobacteria bacterium]|nr:HAMP domain-containing histidine kinase [Gammaproteobacteria bacterium]